MAALHPQLIGFDLICLFFLVIWRDRSTLTRINDQQIYYGSISQTFRAKSDPGYNQDWGGISQRISTRFGVEPKASRSWWNIWEFSLPVTKTKRKNKKGEKKKNRKMILLHQSVARAKARLLTVDTFQSRESWITIENSQKNSQIHQRNGKNRLPVFGIFRSTLFLHIFRRKDIRRESLGESGGLWNEVNADLTKNIKESSAILRHPAVK